MKNTFLYQVSLAVIPSVITGAILYWFFTASPPDLTREVDIQLHRQDIAAAAIRDVAAKVLPSTDKTVVDRLGDLNATLAYGDTVNLAVYQIENSGDREIPIIKVGLGNYIYGYIYNQSFKALEKGATETELRLLPKSSATLVLLTSYSPFSPSERFIVDGKAIEINSDDRDKYDPIVASFTRYLQAYPFLIVMCTFAGIIAIIVVTALFLGSLVYGRNIELFARTYDNKQMSKFLAALTYIHREDPDRYKLITVMAERAWAKWQASQKIN